MLQLQHGTNLTLAMHQSSKLLRLASTHGGMRKILKRKLPVVEFIRKAVETGVHESLHRPVPGQRPGQQSESKVNKYPIEYEILSLNPPIPLPPKIPKKELRQRKQAVNPADKYVKAYMRRYDARMRTSRLVTDAERQDYYYKKTLGIESSGPRAVDMNTAMGLKSPVLKHAYDFALKQYEVISSNDGMTEKDSIAAVEQMLADEETIERTHVREKAKKVVAEKKAKAQIEEKKEAPKRSAPPASTVPSILHNKPRTIQALNIWGQRLTAVPYDQWTLGASTALDHWIAVDVLGMSEDSWNRLLEGESEQVIEESGGMEMNIGNHARMNDIISVRTTFFPETAISSHLEFEDEETDLDDDDVVDDSGDTERSIDELLASLGGFDEDEAEEEVAKIYSGDDQDTQIERMIESLQDWRARNQDKPFAAWDNDTKAEFNVSAYCSFDIQVNIEPRLKFGLIPFTRRLGYLITYHSSQLRVMERLTSMLRVMHF